MEIWKYQTNILEKHVYLFEWHYELSPKTNSSVTFVLERVYQLGGQI